MPPKEQPTPDSLAYKEQAILSPEREAEQLDLKVKSAAVALYEEFSRLRDTNAEHITSRTYKSRQYEVTIGTGGDVVIKGPDAFFSVTMEVPGLALVSKGKFGEKIGFYEPKEEGQSNRNENLPAILPLLKKAKFILAKITV